MYVSLRIGTQSGVGFEAELSGEKGASTTVKFVISVGGETYTYCDEELYSDGDTASFTLNNSYRDITKEKYTVKVYDGDGKLIGNRTGVPGE